VLVTKVEQVPFREIRMGFDFDHSRLDPSGVNDVFQLRQTDIR
jgi:hypothetical protein